jgi:hypothetical protein
MDHPENTQSLAFVEVLVRNMREEHNEAMRLRLRYSTYYLALLGYSCEINGLDI